jgi:hypothetical protein
LAFSLSVLASLQDLLKSARTWSTASACCLGAFVSSTAVVGLRRGHRLKRHEHRGRRQVLFHIVPSQKWSERGSDPGVILQSGRTYFEIRPKSPLFV